MASKKQHVQRSHSAWPDRVRNGTTSVHRSPSSGPIGFHFDIVSQWSEETKLLEAARRAAPFLPAESRAQFLALFSPVNLGITGAVLAAWGTSHFYGVGEGADLVLLGVGAFTIGWQVGDVAGELYEFISIASRAKTTTDLDLAAQYLARAIVIIGVSAFIAILFKSAKTLLGRTALSAREATTSGGAVVSTAAEKGHWWKASDFGEDFSGTSVPKGFIMETGGQKFRVTFNAAKHMAEYAAKRPMNGHYPNPGIYPISPGARFAQIDFPLSSLAGALEQAAAKYGSLPSQRFPLEQFGNWELGIDTRTSPWVVEHALPKGT